MATPTRDEIADGEVLVEVRLDEACRYQGVTAYWPDRARPAGARGQVFATPLAEFLGRCLRDGNRIRAWRGHERSVTALLADDTALCAGGEPVTGRVPTLTCHGQVLLVDAQPLWEHPAPRPAQFRVYLCGTHLPDRLPVRLGPASPVAVWDWLAQTTRGEGWGEQHAGPNRARYLRMEQAMKQAHHLSPDAPNIEVRRAEGDHRSAYRWSLPYLRNYAALLAPGADLDEVDALALRFHRPAAEPVELAHPAVPLSDADVRTFIQAALF